MDASVCTTSLVGALLGALEGFCAYELPVAVDQARGILAVGDSDLLMVERGSSSVVLLHDSDGDGLPDSRTTVAEAPALSHGLAIDMSSSYLYASSDTHVYRWSINNTNTNTIDFLEPLGERQAVIDNMNDDGQGGQQAGNHRTRTLAFDSSGRLYVSVGSVGNVDPDSVRSRIRRFNLDTSVSFPVNFLDGEVFADGVRNEVGLAFDRHGVLWGVENAADMLIRDDLGGDIHEDNPADELNRFREEDAGKNWGYPECWTEFDVPAPFGMGQGTTWAWPSFLEAGTASDEECRTSTVPPVMALQAHSAPLGITFYQWKPQPASCPPNVAFPQQMDGYAFIAYHGSWNRDVPTGYKVVYVPMDQNGDPMVDNPVDLLMHQPPNAQWADGFRPVDVAFDDCGRLLVSSDGNWNEPGYPGAKIVRIENTAVADTSPSPAPALQPTPPPTLQRKNPGSAKCGSVFAGDRGGAATQAKGCFSRGGGGRERRMKVRGLRA